jgi:hypothetical protein
MTYNLEYRTPAMRKEVIERSESVGVSQSTVPWRGTRKNLEEKMVPSSLLLYRAANHRIRTKVNTIKDQSGLDIISNPEDELTQLELHRILVVEAKSDGGSSDLFRVFDKHPEQEESLTITADGVVVNGNRRLAAMRELLGTDGKFQGFDWVRCMVLPNSALEKDLNIVEAEMQRPRDVKQKYRWTDYALFLREQADTDNLSEAELAAIWDFSKDDVSRMLRMLDLAELFLKAVGSNDYNIAERNEQSFKTLATKQKTWNKPPIKSLALQELYLATAWRVISRDQIGWDKYSFIQRIERVAEKSLTLAREQELIPASTEENIFGLSEVEVTMDDVTAFGNQERITEVIAVAKEAVLDDEDQSDSESALKKLLHKAIKPMRDCTELTVSSASSITYSEAAMLSSEMARRALKVFQLINGADEDVLKSLDIENRNQLIDEMKSTLSLLEIPE